MNLVNEDKGQSKQRIDKWLWHARIFKTRSLASSFAISGKIRINGKHNKKASSQLKAGDILTFILHDKIRILKIISFSLRRGCFKEASLLYEDLSPPEEQGSSRVNYHHIFNVKSPKRNKGAGRPTKRERRSLDKLMKN